MVRLYRRGRINGWASSWFINDPDAALNYDGNNEDIINRLRLTPEVLETLFEASGIGYHPKSSAAFESIRDVIEEYPLSKFEERLNDPIKRKFM